MFLSDSQFWLFFVSSYCGCGHGGGEEDHDEEDEDDEDDGQRPGKMPRLEKQFVENGTKFVLRLPFWTDC